MVNKKVTIGTLLFHKKLVMYSSFSYNVLYAVKIHSVDKLIFLFENRLSSNSLLILIDFYPSQIKYIIFCYQYFMHFRFLKVECKSSITFLLEQLPLYLFCKNTFVSIILVRVISSFKELLHQSFLTLLVKRCMNLSSYKSFSLDS